MYRYNEKHVEDEHGEDEMNGGTHSIIIQKLFDFECFSFFNYLCVYFIWRTRNTRHCTGIGVLGYNITAQRINGIAINQRQFTRFYGVYGLCMRVYVYHSIEGLKMKVYFVWLRLYLTKVSTRWLFCM